jgi:hypothetical protein
MRSVIDYDSQHRENRARRFDIGPVVHVASNERETVRCKPRKVGHIASEDPRLAEVIQPHPNRWKICRPAVARRVMLGASDLKAFSRNAMSLSRQGWKRRL